MTDITKFNSNNIIYNIGDEKSRQNFSDAFSITTSYSTGDLVIYDGSLYKFIQDHEAGEWDSEDIEQTTIKNELSTIKNNLYTTINNEITAQQCWEDITNQCTWVTTNLSDNMALYNPFAKAVMIKGIMKTGTPNQHVFCTLPKKPLMDNEVVFSRWDPVKNMNEVIIIEKSSGKIRTSHSVNTTTGGGFSFSGFFPVED